MDGTKALIAATWVAALLGMLFGGGWIAGVAHGVFWLMLVVHVGEFIVVRDVFEKAGGSLGHHFVQTLLFGLFHWRPLKEAQEAQQARPAEGGAAGA